jgi:hypothetical protein
MKGYVKNLRAYDVIIKKMGWWLTGNITITIEDDADFETFNRAQAELEALITASDIEIQDATATAMSVNKFRVWMKQAWIVDRNIAKGHRIEALFDTPVPSTGALFLSHASGVPHTTVGFGIDMDSTLRRIYVALDAAEPTNTYDIRVYENPTDASPTLVVSGKVTITAGSTRVFQVNSLVGVDLDAGEYGIAIERLTGSGESTFTSGSALLVVEEQ